MTAHRSPDGGSSSPARGDGDAFETFYRTTVQRTFDIARRAAAGDKHLAHDATQDAYVEMLPVLHAEETLTLVEAVSVPHMNGADARSFVRRHQRMLEPDGDQVAGRSLHEALMATGRIQVEYVKAVKT